MEQVKYIGETCQGLFVKFLLFQETPNGPLKSNATLIIMRSPKQFQTHTSPVPGFVLSWFAKLLVV